MEKLIIGFFENFKIIMLAITIICFIVPIIYILIKRKKRQVKRDILDKYTILIDSGISSRIGLILFLLIFLIVGMIIIYLAIIKSEYLFNTVLGIIMGFLMCLIPIIITFNTIKLSIKIFNGNYIIVLDKLMDKYYYQDRSYNGEGIDHSGWQLYFKDYFKTYDKYVKFKDLKQGNKYKEGDQFYLVFVKGEKAPIYVYSIKNSILEK